MTELETELETATHPPINQLVKYSPTKVGRKWTTKVTSGKNGGLHKQEEFKRAVSMLEDCAHNLRNPRLYHICLTNADLVIYQLVIKRLCRALKAQGVIVRYRAALEQDSLKGLHMHLMIVLSTDQQTARFITASDEASKIENESTLRKVIRDTWNECATLSYRVNVPQQQNTNLPTDQSKTVAFLQFNQTNQAFFDNTVEWMSYIYKTRSKPSGTCYFSDRANQLGLTA